MNPYMIDLILKEKREEMLRVSSRLQLLAEHEAGRTKKNGSVGLALGELLIRLGERLKNRYAAGEELAAG